MHPFVIDKTLLDAPASKLAAYRTVLQNTVEQKPWFALGHYLLFKSLCGLGGEAYREQAERAALYCSSRTVLYHCLQEARQEGPPGENL